MTQETSSYSVPEDYLDRGKALAWAMYDWANSAFATTVMAGFFRKRNKKVALKPWLRRLTGTHLAMELVASFVNRSDLLEAGERIHERTSTTLSPMPRLVHIPAPACHALLCPRLLMTTRGPQGHLSSRLVLRGTGDGDAQKPFCYASLAAACPRWSIPESTQQYQKVEILPLHARESGTLY